MDVTQIDPLEEALRHVGAQVLHLLGKGERPDGPSPEVPELTQLCDLLGLSSFEAQVLLLGALPTFGARWHAQFQTLDATLAMALALPGATFAALAPDAPLRAHGLIHVQQPASLDSPYVIDERVQFLLVGAYYQHVRLREVLDPLFADLVLVPSQEAVIEGIARWWPEVPVGDQTPLLVLRADAPGTLKSAAASVATLLGRQSYLLDVAHLPTDGASLRELSGRWWLEQRLTSALLVVDAHCTRDEQLGALTWWLNHVPGPVIVLTSSELPTLARPRHLRKIERPTTQEQQELWVVLMDGRPGSSQVLARRFDLDVADFVAMAAPTHAGDPTLSLWREARRRTRTEVEGGRVTRPEIRLDDVIVHAETGSMLRSIVHAVRARQELVQWGLARNGRGAGVVCLFAGPSGTGKSHAAEALAGELGMDLIRVDLASVVSKWVGETERNLRRVFDAAERSGAVLLFDEADSLFGSRSGSAEGQNRWANLGVSYLLQRLEAFDGLAVLTSNLEGSLDQAFERRIPWVVPFPFPAAAERERLWTRVLESGAPISDDDPPSPAELSMAPMTGADIQQAARRAAEDAIQQGSPLGDRQLRAGICAVLERLGRVVPSSFARGPT